MKKISTLIILIVILSLGCFAQSIETIKQNATNLVNALQLTGSEKENFYNLYIQKAQQVKTVNSQNLPPKIKTQKINQTVTAANNQLKNKLSQESSAKFELYIAQGTELYLNPTITPTSSTIDMSGVGSTNPFENITTTTATNSVYNSLPAEHQLALNNIKSQLQLNNQQFNSFTVDYKSFLEALVNIQQGSGNNAQKQQALLNQLVTTSNAVKQYLSTEQYAAYENLVKTNQLGKNSTPQVSANANTYVPTTTLPAVVTPSTNDNGLNSAAVVEIVKEQLGLNTSQVTQTKAILTQYDTETANLKSLYSNNPTKQKKESESMGLKYVPQLQQIMNQNQLLQLAGAIDLQRKLYYGVGLTSQQMQLVNKLKTFGLTDTQISQVALVLVEAAIKGDAIKKSGGSQQEAAQLLSELDIKLQAVLTPAQYNAIKNDIMNQIK